MLALGSVLQIPALTPCTSRPAPRPSSDAVASEEFARYFSGDMKALPDSMKSWCTPYALSIMGQPYTSNCPFGNGNGYGDGRAVSIGEVVVPAETRGPSAEPDAEGGEATAR